MSRISRQLLWVSLVVLIATGCQAQASLLHKQAPEFVRTDFAAGKVDLREFRGKVVLLNFWATWCAPCQVELPKFEQWQKNYGAEGLQIIAVSMDDTEPPVRRTVRRLHLNIPVVMGDAQLGEKYGGVLGLPVTFLIDRNGIIVAEFTGAADLKAMEASIKRLLIHSN